MPRGGKRTGAGRPIQGSEATKTFCFSLRPSMVRKLEMAADILDMSKSQLLDLLIENQLGHIGNE